MIKISLTGERLLKICLEKWRKDLLWVIESDGYIDVNQELGNELREVVADELLDVGLEKDEPTEYGLELEKLIDEIGRLFI